METILKNLYVHTSHLGSKDQEKLITIDEELRLRQRIYNLEFMGSKPTYGKYFKEPILRLS
jgi:hypothetical protein